MRAIIFDFDGVLAATMPQHAKAYQEAFAEKGIEMDPQWVYELEGSRSQTIIRLLHERAVAAHPDTPALSEDGVEAISRSKQQRYTAAGEPQLYEGVDELLRQVKSVPLAIVTGTKKENLEWILGSKKRFFHHLGSQETYTKDKPDPEPYLNAMKALGVAPAECVVVENAVKGIQSAVAAGAGLVVGITTTMPPSRLREAGADLIVGDHVTLGRSLSQIPFETDAPSKGGRRK